MTQAYFSIPSLRSRVIMMNNSSILLGSPNVANVFGQMFRETQRVDVTDSSGLSELLLGDVNVIDAEHPLTISFHSLATRVLTKNAGSDKKPRVYGVEYMVGEGLYSAGGHYNPEQTGEIKQVYAKHEVIISGDIFNTPWILMLSGIGPRKELEAWNIPVVVDWPAVGANLNDKLRSTFDDEDPCFVEWRDNAAGPYVARGSSYGAIWRSSQSWDNNSDLMFLRSSGLSGLLGFYPGYLTGKKQTSNAAGTVRLNSTDPRIHPNINFNYFSGSGKRDLDAIVEVIELLRWAFDATSIPYTQVNPDLKNLRQRIHDLAFSHHASSTCSVGSNDDGNSYVDSGFLVRGVDTLRVVDAYVFLRSPRGMPNAPTWTISCMAFETLLGDSH
ncbi:choline dehydrogenase [Fusarium avenaceum]|nr:choline dehydrogenase [Fusarium avenaceum]